MLASQRPTTSLDRARSGKSGGKTHRNPQAIMAVVQTLPEEGGTFLLITQSQGGKRMQKAI